MTHGAASPGDRAWQQIGLSIERDHPGWKLEYGLYGFTARGRGRVLGPDGLAGIRALIETVPDLAAAQRVDAAVRAAGLPGR